MSIDSSSGVAAPTRMLNSAHVTAEFPRNGRQFSAHRRSTAHQTRMSFEDEAVCDLQGFLRAEKPPHRNLKVGPKNNNVKCCFLTDIDMYSGFFLTFEKTQGRYRKQITKTSSKFAKKRNICRLKTIFF